MDISVGVIIPTFRRVDLTLMAVASAVRQTSAPEQVVVVDDGSPPEVLTALRAGLQAREETRKVELVPIEHTAHPGRVRNAGLAYLTTTHVAFLDSDDRWDPRFLEVMGARARLGHRAIFSGRIEVRPGNPDTTRTVLPVRSTYRLQHMLRSNPICNSSVLIERDLLDEVDGVAAGYALRGVEDYATWLRVAVLTDWDAVATPLVDYRDDPDGSIRGSRQSSLPETLIAHLDLIAWLRARGQRPPVSLRLTRHAVATALSLWARRMRP